MVEILQQVKKNKKHIRKTETTLLEFMDAHQECDSCVPEVKEGLETLQEDFDLRGKNHSKVIYALGLLAVEQVQNQRTIIRLLYVLLALLAGKEGFTHIP